MTTQTTHPADGIEAALKLLARKGWVKRKQGLEMLAILGERDLLFKYALQSREPAVVHVAVAALHPEPLELVRHRVTMVRGADANGEMRFSMPWRNYLFAEDTLIDVYRARKNRLSADVVEGMGLAYLQKMGAAYLPRYTPPLSEEWQCVAAPVRTGWRPAEVLPSPVEMAIRAVVALRRLDLPIDIAQVRRAIDRLPAGQSPRNFDLERHRSTLEWVLYDAGENDDLARLLKISAACATTIDFCDDLATTLLKRRRFADLEDYARENVQVGLRAEFCFWPLKNYLEAKGMRKTEYEPGQRLERTPYAQARQAGIAPPSWWSWMK